MKKILGLDLGTTSIGWALVNEAENKKTNPTELRGVKKSSAYSLIVISLSKFVLQRYNKK